MIGCRSERWLVGRSKTLDCCEIGSRRAFESKLCCCLLMLVREIFFSLGRARYSNSFGSTTQLVVVRAGELGQSAPNV